MQKKNWFTPAMFLVFLLSLLFPEPGSTGGILYPEISSKVGVALVFFLHGLGISFHSLRDGAMQWRAHLLIQLIVFIFFPLIGVLCFTFGKPFFGQELLLGVLYLCALPSTVSSSVALTAAAKGNIALAVFNATLSSLLGIIITPLWISYFIETTNDMMPYGSVLLDLLTWLVLPLLFGQVSRLFLSGWAKKNKQLTNLIDRFVILFLIYASFCDAIMLGVWSKFGVSIVILSCVGSVVLFYLVYYVSSYASRKLKFSIEDRIAIIFCASKKSLATGVPMAYLLFSDRAMVALILFPVMIYHPLQLVVCGWLADKWAKRDS